MSTRNTTLIFHYAYVLKPIYIIISDFWPSFNAAVHQIEPLKYIWVTEQLGLPRHCLCHSPSSMLSDYKCYWEVLSRIKRPTFSITTSQDDDQSALLLESYMSYGLGSTASGDVISQVPCSNTSSRRMGRAVCRNDGLLACSQVWIAHTRSLPNDIFNQYIVVLPCEGVWSYSLVFYSCLYFL